MNDREIFLNSINAARLEHEERVKIEEQQKKDVAAFEAFLGTLETQLSEMVEDNPEHADQIVEEVVVEMARQPEPELPVKDIVNKSVEFLAKAKPQNIQQAADALPNGVRKELDIIKKSITDLHRFASRHSQMGGGGEVNLRYMDDIDTRPTIANNMFLRYSTVKNKFEYANVTLAVDWSHIPANVIPRELGDNLGNSSFYWSNTYSNNVIANTIVFSDSTSQNTAYYDDFIEVYDRTTTLTVNTTPQILKPAILGSSNNITYSNGVFTFPHAGKFAISLQLNAIADRATAELYVYAERNTGSGWVPNQNSGKVFSLINNQRTQIIYSQAVHRAAGEQTRYWIYSNDATDKVNLATTTLPTISNTVYVPSIRVQFA